VQSTPEEQNKPDRPSLLSGFTQSEPTQSEPPSTTSIPSPTKPQHTSEATPPPKSQPKPKPRQQRKQQVVDISVSEDELQKETQPLAEAQRQSRPTSTYSSEREELKMENRKKVDRPRRSTRGKDNILQSDMLIDELATSPRKPKPRAPPRRKPDTARQRLRDDIAAQTKAKANNFLAAHKDYFLPLLPAHNYVSKLKATAPIVKYEELTEQPKGVTATMKPYQLSGLSFLVYLHNNGFSGILGDEMGLGKTLQTLSLFQYLEERDQKAGVHSEELRPYLVVCPLSVLNSWVNEAQKWVPSLKVLRFHGSANERNRLKKVVVGMEDMYGNETNQARDRKASRKAGLTVSKLPTEDQGAQSYKIIVTTYESFQAEQTWFKHSFVWRYVVLDEGHKIKNSVTGISSALKSVSAEYRLILTGTPLQNNLVEMWALLAWLYPDVFTENTQHLFRESFNLREGKVNKQTMDDARRLLELVMLRRMKDSEGVNLNLPPKEEVFLYVPLTPMQRFWYTRLLTRVGDAMLEDLFTNVQSKEKKALMEDKQEDQLYSRLEELEKEADVSPEAHWDETQEIMRQALQKEQSDDAGTGAAWRRLMNLVIQLRKCCSHPYLLPGAAPDPYYLGDHVIRASGKFILLEKLLKHTIYNQGKKVLIFSGFTQTLDCCEDLLTIIGDIGRGFKYCRLDGSTARARRNLDIRMFNDPKSEYKVMLLSTRAGGLGINLTSAEDVIFLDEDWNPQITLQAEARAHRIGQTKKVTIYKLCTQGTVEEQMLGRIRKKLYLSTKITESMRNIHSDVSKTKGSSTTEDMPEMSTTQLKSLVRRGAQTLSHPQIDITEMLSWDLDTMLKMCRDKPSDPQANPDGAPDIDEDKWLATMERVECAVFDGKRHQRQIEAGINRTAVLPSSVSREDRRKGKNVTVEVDGFMISKESLNCADWEAVPTFAGKDPRLAEAKREKRRDIAHEGHCLACFDYGNLVHCKGCPRSYHLDCLEPEFQAKTANLGGFFCAQHECVDCEKKTADAGGLIYRCRWCENGFCEDCLDWDKAELIGHNLPEFEMLGEPPVAGAYYIKCPSCKESMEEDEERKQWLMSMEVSYKEQHELWLQNRDKEQKKIEEEREQIEREKEERKVAREAEERAAYRRNKEASRKNGRSDKERRWVFQDGGFIPMAEDSDVPSPPALTDTSLPTPAPGDSGVSTPGSAAARNGDGTKRRTSGEYVYESREEKRVRLDAQSWELENDPLVRRLTKSAARKDLVYQSKKTNGYFHRE
jgi:SNF2 family DNA or RNA helicase